MSDREAIRRSLVALRVAMDDGHAITKDMMRRPGKRELGRVLHRRNYRDARKKMVAEVEHLMRALVDDSSSGEPDPAH